MAESVKPTMPAVRWPPPPLGDERLSLGLAKGLTTRPAPAPACGDVLLVLLANPTPVRVAGWKLGEEALTPTLEPKGLCSGLLAVDDCCCSGGAGSIGLPKLKPSLRPPSLAAAAPPPSLSSINSPSSPRAMPFDANSASFCCRSAAVCSFLARYITASTCSRAVRRSTIAK